MASLPSYLNLYTPNLGLALFGTDPIQAENMVLIDTAIGGAGAVLSIFGRTGIVVAQAGDYTVAQITGAAPLASPALTGVPTAPTASLGTNNGQIATTAFVFGAVGTETTRAEAAEALLQPLSQLGQPNGYASLNALGMVPTSQLPAVLVNNTFVVASQAAMLALPNQVGEVAVRTDISETFILQATPASVLGNWVQLLFPPAAVLSVNGQTGVVSLAAANLTNGVTGAGAIVLAGTPSITGLLTVANERITGTLADGANSVGTTGQVLSSTGTGTLWVPVTLGTVTSVSFTGGLISVATPTTTPALTVAGTSGGIPYFSSASTWATSAVLPAGDFVLGGGAGAAPTASFSIVPVANGGTGANLSATGGASFVLRQSSVGAVVTVSQLTYADISGTPQLPVTKAAVASNWLNSYSSVSGLFTATQPAFTDISGTATNAQIPGAVLLSPAGNQSITAHNLNLASGTVYSINSDAGMSRLAANSFAFGNGTAGDATATVGLATLNISGQINMNSGTVVAWNSDAGISRLGAASFAFGNGTNGNTTAMLSCGIVRGTSAGGWSIGEDTNNLRIDTAGLSGFEFRPLNAANNNAGMILSNINVTTAYQANGTAGVSAGPFTAVTSITTKQGIVTVLAGTSDERLKISAPYEGGLDAVLAINPVRYRWNEKGQAHTGLRGNQDFIGFIAQDVQRAIPEAITATEPSKDGTETYLSLDDRPIIAALVDAVKTLTARIAALEGRA